MILGFLSTKAIIAFLKYHWRLIAILLAFAAVFAYHRIRINQSFNQGRDSIVEEQKKEAERRDKNASEADRAIRDCARDPSCLLQNDGHRRD